MVSCNSFEDVKNVSIEFLIVYVLSNLERHLSLTVSVDVLCDMSKKKNELNLYQNLIKRYKPFNVKSILCQKVNQSL